MLIIIYYIDKNQLLKDDDQGQKVENTMVLFQP